MASRVLTVCAMALEALVQEAAAAPCKAAWRNPGLGLASSENAGLGFRV